MALAIVEVEDEVVFGDEVAGMKAEEAGSLVNGSGRPLEFDEGADGGFVVVDEEILGPMIAGREFVGSAELFVAEPATKAEAFEDFLQGGSVGENGFQFFADLVATIGRRCSGPNGELLGRRFEGEQVALSGSF